MIDRRTHDLMALNAVQSYTHMAMECTAWAYRYAQTMEGGEATAKQIASIHDQLGLMYQVGLKEIKDAEQADPNGEVRSDDKDI